MHAYRRSCHQARRERRKSSRRVCRPWRPRRRCPRCSGSLAGPRRRIRASSSRLRTTCLCTGMRGQRRERRVRRVRASERAGEGVPEPHLLESQRDARLKPFHLHGRGSRRERGRCGDREDGSGCCCCCCCCCCCERLEGVLLLLLLLLLLVVVLMMGGGSPAAAGDRGRSATTDGGWG